MRVAASVLDKQAQNNTLLCAECSGMHTHTHSDVDNTGNSVLHADLFVKKHTSELYDDVGVGLAHRSLN